MATVAEIETARCQAVRDLDLQVIEAISRRNASSSLTTRKRLDDNVINPMMSQRTRLDFAAVKAQDNSREMEDALRALENATLDLTRTAEHEKTLAAFLEVATSFVDAAGSLAAALESPVSAEAGGGG